MLYSSKIIYYFYFRYRFLYINVGSPGRCNDSQLYESSKLKQQILHSPVLQQMTRIIHGVQVPIVLIGDSAFRLSANMMKPYPFQLQQEDLKRNFNYALSKCRRVVENAFGHLKARFRRVGKGIDNSMDNVSLIIKSSCVLHNYLNERNDDLNISWLLNQQKDDNVLVKPTMETKIGNRNASAEEIRHALACFVNEIQPSRLVP